MGFKNKVVLVTGGSRGIGKASAIKFAKEGANVVINYVKNREEAEKTAKELKKLGSDTLVIQADVSNEADVVKMFKETISKYNKLDVLFANAGIHNPKDPFELTAEEFEKTLNTNLVGMFLCMREAGKIMKKQKYGKIVCTSSFRGLEHSGREAIIDYSASKAGINSMVKNFAKKLGPEITVNAVAPGFIETDMTSNLTLERRKHAIEATCLKRIGEPEEVADAVLFLASEKANFITGHILVIDGGYNLKS